MVHPSRLPRFILPGYHAVREALASGRMRITEIWVREGREGLRGGEIQEMAAEKGIPVRLKGAAEMENLLPGLAHQGMAAVGGEFLYCGLDEIAGASLKTPGRALVVAADHITDEGNLGALVRTCVFFGVQGLVLPKDRSASVSAQVMKRSSGTVLHLPVARVVNLGRALELLAEKGFWILGTAGEGPESIYGFDWRRDLVLVLGSEDKGLSPLIRKRCHQILRIPRQGMAESLNVSVAAGVVLSEIVRQRMQGSAKPSV
ncbi:MAG: 23S rRNA (guanosine(2251)-2'-O)-methyltransferase RlmB [Thermodesulfobacteriota bacterium]